MAATGCGDNLAGPDAAIDAEPIDAPPCPVPTSGYGTLAFDSTHAIRDLDGAGKEHVHWVGALQSGPTADLLDVQLIEGEGAFAGGPPAPGTFALAGVETQLKTCGVCVVLEASIPRQYFVAQGGTVIVDELGPTDTGRFRGSLSNATFVRVMIDPMTNESVVLDDGCHTSITATSWDTAIN